MKVIGALMLLMMLFTLQKTCDKRGGVNVSAGAEERSEKQKSHGVIVVSGIFDPAGERLLKLNPVRRYSWQQSAPTPNQKQGRFALKVTYVKGASQVVPFNALVADDAGHTRHGFFEVVVPVDDEVESVRITDASGAKLFALVKASEFLPSPVHP